MIIKFNQYLLLEASSLTKLGVPKEVMQPIQKDYALSPNVEWSKISTKGDIMKLLKEGKSNLFIQISIDSIIIFGCIDSIKGSTYFIDRYVYKEEISLTQLSYEINPRANVYLLEGEFTMADQKTRIIRKKEQEFEDFTQSFKTEFIQKFDKILMKIVKNKYEFTKAKDKIKEKANKIAEFKMFIDYLDNPIEGANGMAILDEFIMKFEEEYSKYFEEYLNIQEISDVFGRDQLMTLFMYYIHTGKILYK
jgi:hypothetical protein